VPIELKYAAADLGKTHPEPIIELGMAREQALESLCKASRELSKRRRRFDSTKNPAIVGMLIKPGG
jgi:hypothetical protein